MNGPWGRDAIAHSELGPHAPSVWREAMKRRGIRVIAIRRDLERHRGPAPHATRLVHVVAPRPGGPAASAHRCTIDDLHGVVRMTAPLAAGHGLGSGWEPDDARYVLVCTNGRHDPCCATYGRPLVRGLRGSRWAGEVWECSHIGGDRFAGNLVLLPDSLYFGRLDVAGASRVLDAHDHGRLRLVGFRGRSTFRLHEQAAEHYVRAERGLDALDAVRSIERIDDASMAVRVNEDGAVVTYRVTVERTAIASPTPLTCKGKAGPGYPAFRLVELVRT